MSEANVQSFEYAHRHYYYMRIPETICHLILTETPDTQQTSTTPKQTQTIKTHPNTKTLVYYENTLFYSQLIPIEYLPLVY